MRRFTWWDLHERAWRRARLMFVGVGLIVAVYAAGILAVLGVSVAALTTGSLDDVEHWAGDLSLVAVVGAVLVLFAAVTLAILVIGWRGLPQATLRRCGARAPEPGEADHATGAVGTFALACGMPAPRVWILDDPAPNALVFGRPSAGNVCVTSGALRLAGGELEALCALEVTALASRAHAYATSTADLVLLGEWCTRLLWSLVAVVVLTVLVGVPFDIAAAYFVGTVVVVAVTRPLLILADRGLVGLVDENSELVDLEMIRHSAQPACLASLLLDVVEDSRGVRSRWEVAHLWFERDVVEVAVPGGLWSSVVDSFVPDGAILALRAPNSRRTRRELLARAATAIDQAGGDAALRARLDRAAATSR